MTPDEQSDVKQLQRELARAHLELAFSDTMACEPSHQYERALEFMGQELEPDDVFDEEKLAKWAEDNGWKQSD